jgi:hypothetical protein
MELYWGRLKTEGSYPLRRGAWYQVDGFDKDEVLLEVHGAPVSVPRTAIEIVGMRPLRWTVVPRPRQAVRLPESWGSQYAVCPQCCNRSSLQAGSHTMDCRQCEGSFPIAWDEQYLGRDPEADGRARE